MQPKQDANQSGDLNPFSLKNLKRPIPPRQRPKSTSFFKVWIVIILLILALIGGAGYECCRYLIDQSKSVRPVRLPRHSRIQHSDKRRKNAVDSGSNKRHPHPRVQITRQPVRNEKALGRMLDRKRLDLKVADQVLRSYERHSPRIQHQFYYHAMKIGNSKSNPKVRDDQLQKLCKKVNEM